MGNLIGSPQFYEAGKTISCTDGRDISSLREGGDVTVEGSKLHKVWDD